MFYHWLAANIIGEHIFYHGLARNIIGEHFFYHWLVYCMRNFFFHAEII